MVKTRIFFPPGSTRSDLAIFPRSKRSESNFFLPRSTRSDTDFFFSPGSVRSESGFRPLPPIYAVIIRTPPGLRSPMRIFPPGLRGPIRIFPPGLRGQMRIFSPGSTRSYPDFPRGLRGPIRIFPGLRGPIRIFPGGSPERPSAPRSGRNPGGGGDAALSRAEPGRPAPPRAQDAVRDRSGRRTRSARDPAQPVGRSPEADANPKKLNYQVKEKNYPALTPRAAVVKNKKKLSRAIGGLRGGKK